VWKVPKDCNLPHTQFRFADDRLKKKRFKTVKEVKEWVSESLGPSVASGFEKAEVDGGLMSTMDAAQLASLGINDPVQQQRALAKIAESDWGSHGFNSECVTRCKPRAQSPHALERVAHDRRPQVRRRCRDRGDGCERATFGEQDGPDERGLP
jgi:hypothetical protein